MLVSDQTLVKEAECKPAWVQILSGVHCKSGLFESWIDGRYASRTSPKEVLLDFCMPGPNYLVPGGRYHNETSAATFPHSVGACLSSNITGRLSWPKEAIFQVWWASAPVLMLLRSLVWEDLPVYRLTDHICSSCSLTGRKTSHRHRVHRPLGNLWVGSRRWGMVELLIRYQIMMRW